MENLRRSWAFAGIYLAALLAAEALATLVTPVAGVLLHGLILITLLSHGSLTPEPRRRDFLLCLSLAPLIRLLSLSLPLRYFPPIYWYLVLGAPLSIGTFLVARQVGSGFRCSFRLNRRTLPLQIAIGASGIGLGVVEYLILKPEPLVSELRWQTLLLPALILLIFTGFLEELIFRGLMQNTALTILGKWGIVYGAGVYTVMHSGYRSVLNLIFVFAVGLIFGFLALRTRSILGVSLSHGLTNVTLYLILPFLLAPGPL